MNFFQIKAFCAVAEKESFSIASEELFVSTSCLSKTIQSLESELDVSLFIRGRKNVSLTDAGRCFYESALRLLREQHNLMENLASYQGHQKNRIRVAMTTSHIFFSLLAPIRSYQEANPNVSFAIFEYEKDAILKKLDSNEVDVAISWNDDCCPIPASDFDLFCFKREKRVLLCNQNHPVAKQKTVALDSLKNYPFVFPDNPLQRSIYTSLCEKSGFSPTVGAYYNSINTQFELVAQGFGFSFILETMSSFFPQLDVCTVDITPPVGNNLALIRKKGTNSKLIQQFSSYYLDFMKKRYGDVESV